MKKLKAIDSSLKERIRGGAMFGAVVLAGLWFGGAVFAVLMAVAAVIGIQEWNRMVLRDKKYKYPLVAFGVAYIGLSCGVMVWLRDLGLYHMLMLLCIIWASDISAYFSGKAIGGPKLAPKISPKKTWAGFVGSSVGAGAVAAGLAYYGVKPLDMSICGYAATGFVLAMFGQAGDLFISVFKRRYGIKDTGNIIPGHGGVLDRIDALLLVALVFGVLSFYIK